MRGYNRTRHLGSLKPLRLDILLKLLSDTITQHWKNFVVGGYGGNEISLSGT